MTEKLLPVGTKVVFSFTDTKPITGVIREIHEFGEYYKVFITEKEAEKLRPNTYKRDDWEYTKTLNEKPYLWINVMHVKRACRLQRGRESED